MMKMMKMKASALLLAGVIVISLAGCSGQKTAAQDGIQTASNPSVTAATADVTSGTTEEEKSDDISAAESSEPETPPDTAKPEETQPATEPAKTAQTEAPKTEAQTAALETETVKPAESETEPETEKQTEIVQEQTPPAREPETSAEEPTQPDKPKSAYDYAFDVEAIRNDLIAIGEGMGLTHITTDEGNPITPDNASWGNPITASQSYQGESLKRKLTEYVQTMPGLITAYGGGTIEYFTIYVQDNGNGSYTFYFLY